MKELGLSGSFFEMGRQYGKGCRKEIRPLWQTRVLAACVGLLDWVRFFARRRGAGATSVGVAGRRWVA